ATFGILGAVGGGVLASLAFYHVTQTVAVRMSLGSEDRAIAVLTIWGAFSSAIYIPLTAWLVTQYDWRFTLRALGVSTAVMLIAGALTIDTRRRHDGERPSVFRDVGSAARSGRALRFMGS